MAVTTKRRTTRARTRSRATKRGAGAARRSVTYPKPALLLKLAEELILSYETSNFLREVVDQEVIDSLVGMARRAVGPKRCRELTAEAFLEAGGDEDSEG